MVSMGTPQTNILQESSENDESETYSESSKRLCPDLDSLIFSLFTRLLLLLLVL